MLRINDTETDPDIHLYKTPFSSFEIAIEIDAFVIRHYASTASRRGGRFSVTRILIKSS
jgi:hypothetical protein